MHRLTFLQSLIRDLRARYAAGGPRHALAFVAARVRAQLVTRETLVVIAKQLDDIAVPARRGSLRLEPIERRHLPALQELNRERGDVEGDLRFAADLDAGYRGFAGFREDALVACYWWSDRTMPPHRDLHTLGLGIELAPRDAYGFDLYVDKRHRAGGTANEMLYGVESALEEQGYERIWGWVVADNRSARWTYDARGYRPAWAVVRTRTLRRWRNRIEPIGEAGAERKRGAVWTSQSMSRSSSSANS